MVTITKLEKRKNRKEEEFNVLILQGNVEVVISKDYRQTLLDCS